MSSTSVDRLDPAPARRQVHCHGPCVPVQANPRCTLGGLRLGSAGSQHRRVPTAADAGDKPNAGGAEGQVGACNGSEGMGMWGGHVGGVSRANHGCLSAGTFWEAQLDEGVAHAGRGAMAAFKPQRSDGRDQLCTHDERCVSVRRSSRDWDEGGPWGRRCGAGSARACLVHPKGRPKHDGGEERRDRVLSPGQDLQGTHNVGERGSES